MLTTDVQGGGDTTIDGATEEGGVADTEPGITPAAVAELEQLKR